MEKNTFVSFMIALLFSLPISSALATPLGVNLIRNPSAEANGINADCNATIIIENWETKGDTIAIPLSYSSSLTPSDANFPPETFGNNVFFGGLVSAGNSNPRISQTIDISDRAVETDLAMLKYEISGYFGGYLNQNDSIMVYLFCYDQNGQILSNYGIGGVKAANRNNITTLLKRSALDSVQPGTRTIEFVLQWFNASGNYQNGIADNLSLTLSALPGIIVVESQGSTIVEEGISDDSYQIKILKTTTADVDIAITPDARLDIGAGFGQVLNITLPAGVAEPNCVINVSAIDDNDFQGQQTVYINHVVSSNDPNYNNNNFDVEVTLLDNDDPLPFKAGSITMVLIPDTQNYVKNDADNKICNRSQKI